MLFVEQAPMTRPVMKYISHAMLPNRLRYADDLLKMPECYHRHVAGV